MLASCHYGYDWHLHQIHLCATTLAAGDFLAHAIKTGLFTFVYTIHLSTEVTKVRENTCSTKAHVQSIEAQLFSTAILTIVAVLL